MHPCKPFYSAAPQAYFDAPCTPFKEHFAITYKPIKTSHDFGQTIN